MITERKITYTNGALVNTSFATNLDDKNAIVTAPDLSLLLKQAKSQEVKSSKRIEKKYPKKDNLLQFLKMRAAPLEKSKQRKEQD